MQFVLSHSQKYTCGIWAFSQISTIPEIRREAGISSNKSFDASTTFQGNYLS